MSPSEDPNHCLYDPLSFSISFFSSLSLSLCFFLVSVHSGSHLVFLILFYISSCMLSPSLPLSLSLPPIHGSTTYTQEHFFKRQSDRYQCCTIASSLFIFFSAPLPPLARSPNEKLTEYVMRMLFLPPHSATHVLANTREATSRHR